MERSIFHDQCAKILERQEQMLLLFSGDARLTYTLDDTGEQFAFFPERQEMRIPLAFFQEIHADETKLLWHLYEALALYPDWQENAGLYIRRPEVFRPEAEDLTQAYLNRAKICGVSDDAAYQPDILYAYIQEGISGFLQDLDRFASCLIVEAKAPVYRNREVKKSIGEMLLWEDGFGSGAQGSSGTAPHRSLGSALIQSLFFTTDSLDEGPVRTALKSPVLGSPLFDFFYGQEAELAAGFADVDKRDALVHTFVMPVFVKLWKEEIAKSNLQRAEENGKNTDKGEKKQKTARHRPDQTRENQKKMLAQMDEEKKAGGKALRQAEREDDLSEFGVTAKDRAVFSHYEAAVRVQREQMKRFWRQLIGGAAKETGVKVHGTQHGQLDVPLLIAQWPDFIEAQQKQNYRDLRIFDEWELEKRFRMLPETLDISFVIDNSGSMRSGKLPAARKALAIVLLSLQDFQEYLQRQAAAAHTKITLRTEVWLFGTGCRKILSFEDAGRKRTAGTVLSISRLAGDDGTTDDGNCLEKIAEEITPGQARELASGKRIHLIFEVTDGASSFPGSARAAVETLRKKHVEIQALEIGLKGDEEARRIFQYIFGEQGTFLGERTDLLPQTLTDSVKRQMVSVFHGKAPV